MESYLKLNSLYLDTRSFLLKNPEKTGMKLEINSAEHEKIEFQIMDWDG